MQLQTFIYDMHVNKKIYLNCIQDIFSRCQEYMKYIRLILTLTKHSEKRVTFYEKSRPTVPSSHKEHPNITTSKPKLE